MTRLVRGAGIAALVLFGSTAAAQDREADAERLFREAQTLMQERRFGEACPKLEAVYKIDRQLGTLINLAFCHKEQGSIWYAWLEFREAEVKATELGRNDRKDFVRARMAELEKQDQLVKVIIESPQKSGLTDVQVEDRRVPEAERGAVFVVEQGQRRFVFKAKGKKPATALVNVARGSRPVRVAVPDLEDAPPEPPPVVDKPRDPDKGTTTNPPPADKSTPGSTQRTVGWIVAASSVPFLAIGSYAGLTAITSDCKTPTICPNRFSTVNGLANLATVMFVVGPILAVGGITLVLTAPSSSSSSAITLSPKVGAGYLGLDGTF